MAITSTCYCSGIMIGSIMRRILLTCAFTYSLSAAGPDPLYRTLRTGELVDYVTVENLTVKRDAGTFMLKTGVLGFTAAAQGRDTIAVFTGDGEFAFDPPLSIEK